jgi:hypothetical protein
MSSGSTSIHATVEVSVPLVEVMVKDVPAAGGDCEARPTAHGLGGEEDAEFAVTAVVLMTMEPLSGQRRCPSWRYALRDLEAAPDSGDTQISRDRSGGSRSARQGDIAVALPEPQDVAPLAWMFQRVTECR